jgi:hypothetical protein
MPAVASAHSTPASSASTPGANEPAAALITFATICQDDRERHDRERQPSHRCEHGHARDPGRTQHFQVAAEVHEGIFAQAPGSAGRAAMPFRLPRRASER